MRNLILNIFVTDDNGVVSPTSTFGRYTKAEAKQVMESMSMDFASVCQSAGHKWVSEKSNNWTWFAARDKTMRKTVMVHQSKISHYGKETFGKLLK